MMFCVSIGFAQLKPCEIIPYRGDTIRGIGKVSGNKFKYKLTAKGKSDKIHFHDIEQVKVWHSDSVVTTYEYIKIKNVNSYSYKVMRLIDAGKINLYALDIKHKVGSINNNSWAADNNNSWANTNTAVIKFEAVKYYLKKESEYIAKSIRPKGFMSSDYIKTMLPLLNDCKLFVDRVFKGKFKKDDVVGMVKFYNKDCQ